MANCSKVDQLGFGELKKARGLSCLDLSRTRIDFHTLQLLLQHAGNLQHLSLSMILYFDFVLVFYHKPCGLACVYGLYVCVYFSSLCYYLTLPSSSFS